MKEAAENYPDEKEFMLKAINELESLKNESQDSFIATKASMICTRNEGNKIIALQSNQNFIFLNPGTVDEGRKLRGNGIAIYDNGRLYIGEFMRSKREGKGKYTYQDGDVYEGEFRNGKQEGSGTYYCNEIQPNQHQYVLRGIFEKQDQDLIGKITHATKIEENGEQTLINVSEFLRTKGFRSINFTNKNLFSLPNLEPPPRPATPTPSNASTSQTVEPNPSSSPQNASSSTSISGQQNTI
jgi:hypothetical protein